MAWHPLKSVRPSANDRLFHAIGRIVLFYFIFVFLVKPRRLVFRFGGFWWSRENAKDNNNNKPLHVTNRQPERKNSNKKTKGKISRHNSREMIFKPIGFHWHKTMDFFIRVIGNRPIWLSPVLRLKMAARHKMERERAYANGSHVGNQNDYRGV